jgi:chemotaxis protein MotB
MRSKNLFLLVAVLLVFNGCAVILQKGRRSDIEKIRYLKSELESLRRAQGILSERLSEEIEDEQVRLGMADKGLVITFVAEVLFDSGKAELREASLPILDKVVRVLKEEVPQNDIGIEGHTDNVPIKHSPWRSNWELSAHRALGVLYYLEDEEINSERLSAVGYGKYRPVAGNDTAEGRQLNRRVEIVIVPRAVKMTEQESADSGSFYEGEDLK